MTLEVHAGEGRTPASPARTADQSWLSSRGASRHYLPLLCVLLDVVLVLAAVIAAYVLRESLSFLATTAHVNDLVEKLSWLIVAGWVVALAAFGTYAPHQLGAGIESYRNVVNASFVTASVVGIVCYMGKVPLSRGFFLLTFVIGIPLLLVGRLLFRRSLHVARRRGVFVNRLLIAGTPAQVDEISTVLRRESWLGFDVVGALRATFDTTSTATPRGMRYVGSALDAAEVCTEYDADAIIVAAGAFASSAELRRAQWALEDGRVQLMVVPNVTDVARERVRMRPMAGLPLVHLERPQSLEASRWAKRAFDVVGALVAIILTSPVLLVAAIAVRRFDGGPILFRQQRVGRDGTPFAMLKFRSMVTDAEQRLEQLRADNESDGLLFKMTEDPRITRPGRWMRRTSIDELPQLLNVLRGDMSLVGPRPALRDEVAGYDADVARRLRVRPGMTGLWQVSGRSDLSWEDTVRLDLYYVDNWSMLQDLVILLRTSKAVLASDGAY